MTAGLNHRRAGQGEPMVLIHGIGSSLRVWDPVFDRLATAHDVLALDLPGFGRSRPLRDGAALADLADEVEDALDDLGWDTAHLVGNSLGGAVSLELALRGRARSVVALSPGGFQSREEDRFITAALRVTRAAAIAAAPLAPILARVSVVRRLGFGMLVADTGALVPDWTVEATRSMANSTAFPHVLEAFDPPGFRRRLRAGIDAPVRVAWGSKDRLLWPRQAQRVRQVIPHADIVRLDGLGHMPMSDDPVRVVETILSWTARTGHRR